MAENICNCGCTKALKYCPDCGEPYTPPDPIVVALENALAHACKRKTWWTNREAKGTLKDADIVTAKLEYWNDQANNLVIALKHEIERKDDDGGTEAPGSDPTTLAEANITTSAPPAKDSAATQDSAIDAKAGHSDGAPKL